MAYSPTFTQTEKTKRSLLVVPIKISESPWLSQSRSQLTPKSNSIGRLVQSVHPQPGFRRRSAWDPSSDSGVVSGKAGVQAGELGRNDSIKHTLRTFFIMNER